MKYPVKKVSTLISAVLVGATLSTNAFSVGNAAENNLAANANNIQNSTSPLPKRYIVKYKNGNSLQRAGMSARGSLRSRAAGLGATIKADMPNMGVFTAEVKQSRLAELRADADVEYVEEDLIRYALAQTSPYGIGLVQADLVDDSVAAASAGGKKVCVIDSGLDLPHEDMGTQGGTINGTNDVGTGNWFDEGGPHGTHVAGTIAALNNGVGVRGVIGSDVSLHIVKVFNAAGWAYSSSLADAITTCANNGADVINMSLGGAGSSITEQNALQATYDAGVLMIAAAGNDGVPTNTTDALSYPASYDSVMSVAAIDSTKALADFSQKNSQVEIAAPGVDVLSTFPTGTGTVSELTVGTTGYSVNGMENQGTATGGLYNFATGEAIDTGAAGRICLIERGVISFHDKVKNCEDSGGAGAIIYNNVAGALSATLGTTNVTTIPAVTAAQADGQAMLTQIGQSTTVNIGPGNYSKLSGTSMASPHVAGVAALAWSHHPTCTNAEIRAVLNATAEDLGAVGRDVQFGYGLVQAKAAVDYITANGCDGSGGGTTPPPTGNILQNGVAVTAIGAATGTQVTYTMEVPVGATNLSFAMSGGTGDADLYVKFGTAPTLTSYDCRPYATGNNETCDIANVQAGTYHVMLNAYSTFADVSLTGSYTEGTGGGGNILTNGVATTNISGATAEEIFYTMEVPAGAANLSFAMAGGTGDADMYVKFGSAPTTTVYDCRPYASGNNETCDIANVQAGTYHVMLKGYSAFSGVSLTGSYTESTGGGAASYTNTANYNIPDNSAVGVSSPITSTRTGASNIVAVDVDIVHTYIGDLTVDLIHPDGTVYNLHNRTGSSANNILQSYSVDVGLKDSAGVWNLRAKDSAGADTGYINSWTISFQ